MLSPQGGLFVRVARRAHAPLPPLPLPLLPSLPDRLGTCPSLLREPRLLRGWRGGESALRGGCDAVAFYINTPPAGGVPGLRAALGVRLGCAGVAVNAVCLVGGTRAAAGWLQGAGRAPLYMRPERIQ
jgi:hypothetical protein